MTKSRRHIHAAMARALETWAAQKRLALIGRDQGYAPRCIVDKLRKEREGAGEAWKPTQVVPDLYRGDGARIQQVVVTLPDLTRFVLTCNYLFRGQWYVPVAPPKTPNDARVERPVTQTDLIGISKAEYWNEVHAGEIAIASGVIVLERVHYYRSA